MSYQTITSLPIQQWGESESESESSDYNKSQILTADAGLQKLYI